MENKEKHWLTAVVVLGALGYFVDIYDLILFAVVRIKSLQDLGVPAAQILPVGISLLNWQMLGMLIGGVLWGVLGDRRGRLSVLFGSILLYSIANILSGMMHSLSAYPALRFLAGLGLAGELGAAVTLVSESLPKEKRGLGTTLVATVGVAGAIAANVVAKSFDWRTAYFVGGGLGLLLLLLRLGTMESSMFDKALHSHARRGDLGLLLGQKERILRYLRCILIGLPTWFVVGILITLAPELCGARGVQGVDPGNAVMWAYSGLVAGDFASGWISQYFKNRNEVVLVFLLMTALFTVLNLYTGNTPGHCYALSFLSGFGVGYWAMFVTIAAEQFGTNLRATVAVTVPNWARGALVPISFAFLMLQKHGMNPDRAALWVGMVCIAIAIISVAGLRETFGTDLDYMES